jgi:outer membrane lipoprotein-sorting protein
MYINVDQYKLVAAVSYRDPDEGLNLSGFITIAIRKPHKIRWEVKGNVAQFLTGAALDSVSISDGQNTWIYAPALRQYMKEEPPTSETIAELEELFLDYRSLVDMANRAQILREETLSFNGSMAACYVVEVRDGPIDIYRLWIDSKRFLVLREDKESKDDPKAQYYSLSIMFSAIDLGGPLDERSFVFSPPANAKRVTEILP